MTTQFQLHVEQWKNCQRCSYSKTRSHVVLARGSVPADVVFVGEGPGKSEDVLASPFVGPAGRLLDSIIAESIPDSVSYALTNVVCCLPVDEEGEKAVEPSEESIKACAPRLLQFLEICQPKLIVCVGKLATIWLSTKSKLWEKKDSLYLLIPRISILHPAYILRQAVVMQGILRRKCVIAVKDGVEQYLDKKE